MNGILFLRVWNIRRIFGEKIKAVKIINAGAHEISFMRPNIYYRTTFIIETFLSGSCIAEAF